MSKKFESGEGIEEEEEEEDEEHDEDDEGQEIIEGEEEEEEDNDVPGVMPDCDRTPVTIVTGFLGSGKSTLVNYILKEQTGKKIAVIENEYGAVSIDDELVSENLKSKESIITMSNGCVCCTVRGDLMKALFTLADRNFDAVLIETTGLADPAPVAFTFNDEDIKNLYRIDSILCVVDAKNVLKHIQDVKSDGSVNEAISQIAFADRILLNKLDLVTPQEKQAVCEEIHHINAFAELLECVQSRVDLNRIINVSSFSIETAKEIDRVMTAEEEEVCPEPTKCKDHTHGHSHNHDKDHHGHGHSVKKVKRTHNLSGVTSVGLLLEGTVSLKRFDEFMNGLLKDGGAANLYRSKGVLSFNSKSPLKSVFHGVHEQIQVGLAESQWGKDEKRVNKMVFIGRNLPADLEERARMCLYKDGEDEDEIEEEEEEEEEVV